PGAAEAVEVARRHGTRVVFVTNNSSGTLAEYAQKLQDAGIVAPAGDIVTSAQAAAALLTIQLPAASRVLACAGDGVREALDAVGFTVVDDAPADAVVVGWHRTFNFEGLARAANVVRSGACFVATNLDATYPVVDGLLPGAGAIVAAVATAGGRQPEVAGKPEAPMVELVRARCGPDGVMVGDRPSTDGALAAALGWPFALVLSGVAGTPGEEPVPDPRPPYVTPDLAALVDQLYRS
ncbi:MAG TPA: HAD-IIA family hydrolase, partial [Acidimicrobiia bacterium]|nr:HAD-IIA family hydrolase [Acidimicrobiia bacterium]